MHNSDGQTGQRVSWEAISWLLKGDRLGATRLRHLHVPFQALIIEVNVVHALALSHPFFPSCTVAIYIVDLAVTIGTGVVLILPHLRGSYGSVVDNLGIIVDNRLVVDSPILGRSPELLTL